MEVHEHPDYARMADLVYTNDLLGSTITRLNYAEEDIRSVVGVVGELRESTASISIHDTLFNMYSELRTEVDSIKGAIIEIQDSLRRLGMDDMQERLGDIQTLLT